MGTRALTTLLSAALLACTPGSGALSLEARSGRIVDRDTGAAIADADVFQVYWGRGLAGEPRPARALRWSESGSEGGFSFEPATSRDVRAWVLETDEAEYGFFHPDYGVVRSGPATGGSLSIAGARLDAEMRRVSDMELCGSRPADAVLAAVQARHCRPRTRPQQ